MNGGIIAAAVTPHTPRMGIEAKAPSFLRGVIAGSYELGKFLRSMNPDVLIVNSAHWVSTFNWYVTCQTEHLGYAVADEAPDLIPGVPYRRPGLPAFAAAVVDEIKAAGYPCFRNESEHFQWDYGSFVPLQYIDPDSRVPAVLIPTCISADLEESLAVGAAIRSTAQKTGVRAVFLASCSLTHKLVRGPEQWPAPERMELDRSFIKMLCDGRISEAKRWFADYARQVVAEMGGRDIAAMLGCLAEGEEPYTGRQFGAYGQSSASGNTSVAVWPAA
jgi:3,4-dihydroxyphenylacetate 2,3-dioxygenase